MRSAGLVLDWSTAPDRDVVAVPARAGGSRDHASGVGSMADFVVVAVVAVPALRSNGPEPAVFLREVVRPIVCRLLDFNAVGHCLAQKSHIVTVPTGATEPDGPLVPCLAVGRGAPVLFRNPGCPIKPLRPRHSRGER